MTALRQRVRVLSDNPCGIRLLVVGWPDRPAEGGRSASGVQGSGRGAAGEAGPSCESCPGAAGQRDASAYNGVGKTGGGDRSCPGAASGRLL